jgi:type IV fimbrial biogenesis protein FimT
MRDNSIQMINNDKMKTQNAFTLVELMVTLAVASILVMMALPNMRYMLLSNRITSKANELVRAINYVRSESIVGHLFNIEPLDSNGPNEWGQGWEIVDKNIVDENGDNKTIKIFEFGEDLIKVCGPTSMISFTNRGRVNGEFQFVIYSDNHSSGRELTLRKTGRTKIESCSTNANGSENQCGSC